MRNALVAVLFVCLNAATICRADEAPPVAADPVLEKRVMNLSEELRCLVCQNQTLADSHADLAIDLRNQVREQMQAGKSDAEIREFMVARYGDFVLYNPPVKSSTLLLWAGPFVLLLLAVVAFSIYLVRRKRAVAERVISADQRTKARELLAGSAKGEQE